MKHVSRVKHHVLSVAWEVAKSQPLEWYGFFTVGEVWPITEYSRNTVQKYVDMCVGLGLFREIKHPKLGRMYRIVEGEN